MKIESIPIYALLMFTAVYMLFGKDTPFWNGTFFVLNYAMISLLFYSQKDKMIRILGTSLSLTIMIFSILKFFISLNQDYLDILNTIIFALIAISLYKLEPK